MELVGEECICMIQDYTKRIKSVENNPDIRLELSNIVNEFSVFAKKMQIPLISAAQLNRNAMNIAENNLSSGKKDIGKNLGASNIGESALIIENTDVGVIINREFDKDTEKLYLSFNLVVNRGEDIQDAPKYFAQPFENGMRLQEDIDEEIPVGVERIGSAPITEEDKEKMDEASRKRIASTTRSSKSSSSKQINKSSTIKTNNKLSMDDDLKGI